LGEQARTCEGKKEIRAQVYVTRSFSEIVESSGMRGDLNGAGAYAAWGAGGRTRDEKNDVASRLGMGVILPGITIFTAGFRRKGSSRINLKKQEVIEGYDEIE
jgi:hypothetical protein